MTVKKINRSHRMAYMAVLLALAIALTTMLVLPGESNVPSQKENVAQPSHHSAHSEAIEKGDWRCVGV